MTAIKRFLDATLHGSRPSRDESLRRAQLPSSRTNQRVGLERDLSERRWFEDPLVPRDPTVRADLKGHVDSLTPQEREQLFSAIDDCFAQLEVRATSSDTSGDGAWNPFAAAILREWLATYGVRLAELGLQDPGGLGSADEEPTAAAHDLPSP